MTQLTDEILVAYVDGELPAEEAAEVEKALKADQNVREAVQVFRDTAEWSRRAYDDVLHEPVPERLISAASGEGANRPAKSEPRHRPAARGGLAGMAMAASVALAIGLGGGFGLFQMLEDGDGGSSGPLMVGAVDEAGALHLALESAGTGMLIATGDGGNVMPLMTFLGRDGRYCREFQAVTSSTGSLSASFGIACRQPAGTWHVEAIGAPPAVSPASSDRFETAGGALGDPMQVLIGAMSESGPVNMDSEAALLANGWQ